MDKLWLDMRCGARMLARTPAFTAVAILTLGIAIGANTAIFSVVRAVILRPLPYLEPERLVVFHNFRDGRSNGPHSSSMPDFEDWRERSDVFDRIALFAYWTFKSMLFEVEPADPGTLIAVVAFLSAVAAGACYLPARRAVRMDPILALRHE